MKKVLIFLITLCLIFNTAVSVFAEADTDSDEENGGLKVEKNTFDLQPEFSGGSKGDSDVYNDIVFEKPSFISDIQDEDLRKKAEVLYDIGVIESVDVKKDISRGEFVAMAAHIANVPVSNTDNSQYFTDVDGDTAYHNEIEAVAAMGLISGDNGMFYPARAITFNESVSIIMKAIGYGAMSELKGGYPSGYLMTAKQSGVLTGSFVNENTLLSGDMAVRLLYNTLFADVMKPTGFSDKYVDYDTDQNVLEFFHDIYVVNGQVTANHLSSFRNVLKTADNEIRIGDDVYTLKKDKCYTEYFGYKVEAFVREIEDKDTVVSMVKDNNVKEQILDVSEIYDFSDYTYYYGKNKKSYISADHIFILNGIRQTDYTNELFVPENGEVVLVYNDGGSKADVVIVNEYQPFLLNQFRGTDKNELEFNSVDKGVKFFIDPENTEQTVEFYFEGLRFDVNSQYVILKDADGFDYRQNILPKIPTPSVLNIFADKYTTINGVSIPSDDAEIIRIYVTSTTLEGTVNSVSAAKDSVKIGDSEYNIAERNLFFIENTEFKPGKSGKFFFDFNNNIVAWIADTEEVNSYGYLINAKCSDTGFDKYDLQLKIIDSQGNINVYDCKDRVRVNGKVIKDLGDVYIMLKNAASLVHNDDRISQVVKYELNKDNEIFSLTLVNKALGDGKTENEITRNCEKQGLQSRKENNYSLYNSNGAVYYNSGCKVIFSVPEDKSTEEKDFYKLTVWGDNREERTVEVYDTDDYLVPGVVVVYRKEKEELRYPYFMVDHVSRKLDQNGDVTAVVYGTNGDDRLTASYTSYDVSLFDDLKCGDFVKLYGKNNFVTDYDMLMSVDDVKKFDFSTPFVSTSGSVTDLFELYSVYENRFMTLQRGSIVGNGVRETQICAYADKLISFIYDETKGAKPRIGYFYNPEYLDTALNDGIDKASKVFIYTSGTVTKFVVVYKGI